MPTITWDEMRSIFPRYLINSTEYSKDKIQYSGVITVHNEGRYEKFEGESIIHWDHTFIEFDEPWDRMCLVYLNNGINYSVANNIRNFPEPHMRETSINTDIEGTHRFYGIKNGNKVDWPFEYIPGYQSSYEYEVIFPDESYNYTNTTAYTSNFRTPDLPGTFNGLGCWACIKYLSTQVNVPIFLTTEDADNYLDTGDTSNAVNPFKPDPDNLLTVYYYDYIKNTINKNDNKIISTSDETGEKKFKLINADDKVAFVRTTGSNYTLQCTNSFVLALNPLTAKYDTEVPFDDFKVSILRGREDFSDTQYYYGDIQTNIQFVESLGNAGENEDDSEPSFNGEDSPMSLTDISVATLFTKPYYVSATELNHIGNILFANDETFQNTLKKGLWMYNENPIDCVIDLCLYPFRLDSFIDSTESRKLKFGSFEYNGEIQQITQTNYDVIKGCNGTLTLVNQRIIPVYNDFRDYSNITYSLFLPYYGMIELDNSIVDRVLKIDAKLDIFTSQLKYYIFIDNTLLTVCECAVGRHISMIGTDWINKSNKNLSAVAGMYSGMFESVNSVGALDASGAINGIIKTLFSYKDYMEKPKTQTTGTSTSGLNIYDPMSVFLITEQYETIKPTNLNAEYGKPTYRIAKMNTCSGYTEVSDIKLKTRALDSEYNEIVNILKNGIII